MQINDIVHFSIGVAIAIALYLLTGVNFLSIPVAFLIGIGVELYQYYGKHEGPKMADRLCDIAGYTAGSIVVCLIIYGVTL